eukprot:Gregarina_sp_Pseudo_9__5212@NODE_576_length_2557_cov_46_313344_g545_i0_p1_GENE_NODE_576_length_2557_cov_46_313344_g545_i0NODE_576_length_2557_cov_46_313344_g545_i0_p1_ORF_typecomplete_len497_score92_72XRCC4/PF06632_12/3_4e03XRCC4/PF06632_12/7_3e09DUF812/PF05667_11/0_02PIN_8/PF18476_1/0_061DUF452/PF04301_13/0_13DUF452/PF04301_13/3_5e03_NODE_576_length_2557_cov_46_313344_g545_i04211911
MIQCVQHTCVSSTCVWVWHTFLSQGALTHNTRAHTYTHSMSPRAPAVFDPGVLSLGTLFDSSYATQQDYLYELEAVTPRIADDAETQVRAGDLAVSLHRLDHQTFSIVDLLSRHPTAVSEAPKKRRLLHFPAATAVSRPRLEEAPVSRIALLSQWEPEFNSELRKLKMQQLATQGDAAAGDATAPPRDATVPPRDVSADADMGDDAETQVFVRLDVFDGLFLWKGEVRFGDLHRLDSDTLSHIFRFLVYGKSLESTKNKTLVVRGYFEKLSESSARLHLFHSDPLLKEDGIKLEISEESKEDFVSRLFVASFKRQILTQSLLTNLLYSLRTIQDSTFEVLKESRKLSESAKQSREEFLAKVLKVVNSKKEKIVELQNQIEQMQSTQPEVVPEIKAPTTPTKPRAKPKAKGRSKAKAKAKQRTGSRRSSDADNEGDDEGVPSTLYFEQDGSVDPEPEERRPPPEETRIPLNEKGQAPRQKSPDVEIDLFSGWASDDE